MIDFIIYISMFLIGIFFGSFFTLAVYRIPRGEDILYKQSHCPNCNHKLGFFDLFPIFSYIFLGGKCRYCKKKIHPRYLIIEVLSGIVFLLFAMSFKFNQDYFAWYKNINFLFGILYFVSLFIIAGIDKEKIQIQRSVLVYGSVIAVMQMLYLGLVMKQDVTNFIVALTMLITLIIANSSLVKEKKYKNSVWNYTTQVVILGLYMLIVTGKEIFIPTLVSLLLSIMIYVLIEKIIKKNKKVNNKNEKDKKENKIGYNNMPIGFMFCSLNIVWILVYNFLWNYIV